MGFPFFFSGTSSGGSNDSGSSRWPKLVREKESQEPHVLSDPEEAKIVARIREGDMVSFERLYKQYARALVISAEGYIRSAAEDVVADVFTNLWRLRSGWTPRRSIKAYLFAAVRNASIGQLRHDGVEQRSEVIADEDSPPAMGQPPEDIGSKLELGDRIAAINAVLATFPESRRQIMYMRWQQGMSADEIASVLGVTRNAVDLQLSRAIRALRDLLPDWVRE